MILYRSWILVPILLTLSGCMGRSTPEPILIGHLAPFSGPDRATGEAARQAIELLLPELSADQTKNGGRPVVVLHVDSRNDEQTVSAETVRLIAVNRVAGLIGTLDAKLGERMVREAQSYAIPAVLTGEALDLNSFDGIWPLSVPAATRGQALARWMAQQKHIRVAVTVDVTSPPAVALSSVLLKQLRQEKNVLVREGILKPQGDGWNGFEDLLTWKPDVLLVAASPALLQKVCTPGGLIVDETGKNRFGPKMPIVYGGEDVGPLTLSGDNDLTLVVATVICREGLTASGQEFVASYTKKVGQEPVDFAFLQTADALRLMVESIHPGKTTNTAKPREKLVIQEPFQSFTGKVTFRDQKTQRPIFLLERKAGKTSLVTTVEPGSLEP
jgi:ABC-type branched-subunit amino acid transport system substrate-binding protein